MSLIAALAVAALISLTGAPPAGIDAPLTRHAAKIRTFEALLRITEQPPDTTDATRAAITVAGCRRLNAGYLCHGTLTPVAFSGIDGTSCHYVVAVYPHATRVTGACR
jgi:hypothetical protein